MLIVLVMGKVLLDSSKMLVLVNMFELVDDKRYLMEWVEGKNIFFMDAPPALPPRGMSRVVVAGKNRARFFCDSRLPSPSTIIAHEHRRRA